MKLNDIMKLIMRVIEPWGLHKVNAKKSKHNIRRFLILLVVSILVSVGSVGYYQFSRPFVAIKPELSQLSIPGSKIDLAWPAYGQSAVSAVGYGLLGTSGQQNPVPIASVAKIITALTVLKKQPLALNEQGPMLILDEVDVSYYHNHVNQNGSVVPVNNGEQISQYQALQALLLPSANNMADSLARWAFGSIDAYLESANEFSKLIGMKNTTVSDPSGLSEKTVSTASDLVILGQVALANPVVAEIVSQAGADIPVAGRITNVNKLLANPSVIGIKTGNTNQAGGCYLIASSKRLQNGQNVTAVGVILGAVNLETAIRDSQPLIQSVHDGFKLVKILGTNQVVGNYKLPWGGTVSATAKNDLEIPVWESSLVTPVIQMSNLESFKNLGEDVGFVTLQYGGKDYRISVVTSNSVSHPSIKWKILRR